MQICNLADHATFKIPGDRRKYKKLPKGRFVQVSNKDNVRKMASLPRGIRTEVKPA